jgi:hypothetical protein
MSGPVRILLGSNLLIMIANLFTKWIYYIDGQNVYHRCKMFFIYIIVCYSMIVCTYILLLFNRKRIPQKLSFSIFLFTLPPIFGNILQAFTDRFMFTSNCLTLSILLIFLNVQYNSSSTDYLTGLFNRRQLDEYIRFKIKNSNSGKTFSAILLDVIISKRSMILMATKQAIKQSRTRLQSLKKA